ncbi:MAG: pectin acetylesterase-family hydrolase [Archaeoglobaceae archaeon]
MVLDSASALLTGTPAPQGIPTLAIWGWGDPSRNVSGAMNVYYPNLTHVEVATSPLTFVEMFRFFTGRDPITPYILPEKEITIAGKVVYFPYNTVLTTGTLKIYEVDENGFRTGGPIATISINDGNFSFTGKSGVRYEFELTDYGCVTAMHVYREPFLRSTYWMRILVSPPGGLADYADRSENHTNILVLRYREIVGQSDPNLDGIDTLKIDGTNVCTPSICPVAKRVNGVWIYDKDSDKLSNLTAPIQYYYLQPFQTGVDFYIPASDPPSEAINITIESRGGGVQTLKVPNWKSSEHRVILQFNDYVQTYLLDSDAEVLVPTYADPFSIDISGMTDFATIPEDDPSDGINWIKVDLPYPCVNGVGNSTFIMVRKGYGEDQNKVLIYLEGGGACFNFLTCRPTTQGGTVITLEPNFTTLSYAYRQGIFNVTNPNNPFRNWTIVFVPYGTGDIHMGNRVVKYYNISNPLQNKTIYHVGYVNAIVAMRWINASGNFDQIVVTGTSAGGFGTILHFYRASEIFNKGVIAINDAGPGTAPNVTSAFQPGITAEKWGSMQNYPPQSLPYFADTDTIRFLNWALNGSAGGCGNCIYALFEDQWDFVIGPYFQGYSFTDFQARLLNAIESIKANFSDRFCSYLPLSTYHTAFAGGYNYPAGDRFYNLHIDGYTLV